LTIDVGLSEDESHDQASFPQRGIQAAGCAGIHRRRDATRLSQRHDISRQLIRIWVGKYEAGALDDDVQAADLLQEYEAKIAALERMVGRQALEIEFLKGALKSAPRPRSETTSVIAGPAVSPPRKDVG
jgi:transposase-like protein